MSNHSPDRADEAAEVPSSSERAEPLFDVVAVNIKTGEERFIDEAKTERNAEAIERIVIFRRGVNEEFYKVVPHPHTLAKARSGEPGKMEGGE